MDLTLIRHGRTASNNADLISGAGLNSELSPDGIEYAERVSEVFDENEYDVVYASPLIRAKHTAEILTKGNVEINYDRRLEEIHFGEWEGQSADDLRLKYPDAFDYVGMIADKYNEYSKDSESYDDVIARCDSFLADLKKNHPNDKILIVAHGFTIRAMFAAVFKNDIFEYAAVDNVTKNEIHLEAPEDFRPRMFSYNKKILN